MVRRERTRGLLPPERIEKLLPVAFRHGMTADAVAGGPAVVFGHVMGAEDLVEKRDRKSVV